MYISRGGATPVTGECLSNAGTSTREPDELLEITEMSHSIELVVVHSRHI
jgi:hypothetical protein